MKNIYSLTNLYPLDYRKVKVLLAQQGKKVSGLVAGLTQPTISNHIAGRYRNRLIQQAIADALGVPLSKILLKPKPARDAQDAQHAA